MPISIPTSIAGISVPGTINGPLQLLYGNKFEFTGLKYPRNLGSDATRSHVIKFTSMRPDPDYKPEIVTETINVVTGGARYAGAVGSSIAQNAQNVLEGKPTVELPQAPEDFKKSLTNLSRQIAAADIPRKPDTSIALYIPDTVNVTYGASYDDISLTESLGKAYFLAQAGTSMLDLFNGSADKTVEQLANKLALLA